MAIISKVPNAFQFLPVQLPLSLIHQHKYANALKKMSI